MLKCILGNGLMQSEWHLGWLFCSAFSMSILAHLWLLITSYSLIFQVFFKFLFEAFYVSLLTLYFYNPGMLCEDKQRPPQVK